MKNLFLVQFAQRHLDFRIPELESVSQALNIPFEQVSPYRPESPFLIIKFPLDKKDLNGVEGIKTENSSSNPIDPSCLRVLAKRLASRCILIKSISELIISSHSPSSQLPELLRNDPYYPTLSNRIKNLSFKFSYSSYGSKLNSNLSDQLSLFDKFSFLPTGPVQLDEDEVEVKFQIFEDFSTPTRPTSHFGLFVGKGGRDLIVKYDVKKRPYIGTTSMDAELSLIMANMGCIKDSLSIGNDPFAGTGSLLLAMSAMGAFTVGGEIDSRQLRGGATFDKTKRPQWDRVLLKCHVPEGTVDWWSNVVHYQLTDKVLGCLVSDIASSPLSDSPLFDCIVTDPPYGIRAGVRKGGRDEGQLGFGGQLHIDTIIIELLNYSAKKLRLGGRLVFWFPVVPEDNLPNPSHPSFRLLYCSVQECGKWSRRLLTMEKVNENCTFNENNNLSPIVVTNNFREKYFSPSTSK